MMKSPHPRASRDALCDIYLDTHREFIQQMAYVEGLTHAGPAKTPAERGLLTARKNTFRRGDNLSEPNLDLLKQIGRITHTGLAPLSRLAEKPRLAQGLTYPRFEYEAAIA